MNPADKSVPPDINAEFEAQFTSGEPWPHYNRGLPILAITMVPPGGANPLCEGINPDLWTYVVYERLGQYIGWTQELRKLQLLFSSTEHQRNVLRAHRAKLETLRQLRDQPLGLLTLKMILGSESNTEAT